MLVMFDLDGTLTDPVEGITGSVAYAFERLGLTVPESEVLRAFIGPPLQDMFATWLPAPSVPAAVAYYRERFGQIGWRENRVYDGIPQMLDGLIRAGNRLAVVTSKPTVYAERILEHFDLRRRFEAVVGATLDGTLRHKVDLVRVALSDADVEPADALMVGDRDQDVRGARANQVRAVGVAWGYANPGELEDAGADTVIRHPEELAHVAYRRVT